MKKNYLCGALWLLALTVFSTKIFSQSDPLVAKLLVKAGNLKKQRLFLPAAQTYVKAAKVENKLAFPNYIAISGMLDWAGYCYRQSGRYKSALTCYKQAIRIEKALVRQERISKFFNEIGHIYKVLGKYKQALDHFQKALAIDRKLGKNAFIAIGLNNIGEIHRIM